MKDQLVLRVVAKLLIPCILLFALYTQMHGDYGPGGGFQAGVIFASAFILYALVFGLASAKRVVPLGALAIFAPIGLLIYAGVGVASLIAGGNFLEYAVFAHEPAHGNEIGIFLVEIGVGVTVAAVMIAIYFSFAGRR